ncbi:hypothetical protein P296_13135 [Salmonella enterica subsp. arizonae serovar 18:z4,z23:- str. CVM N26624]|nr:hypothetical protein DD48_20615 [Salmonella enterica subsp. arizonae serovar 18:z4,z23:-]KTY97552.1 hypothetical protein DD91_04640 [Salmonella enterica subsp. arizonae serovar 18:z4,z23:- str. CVM N31597]OLV95246.1 hypothetical protein P297_20445 [Salmonella enterica subsp. arizonae serovar 18:z4,z23:- str. CVM N26625]OLW00499.1 hypothetical protein P296_13135 [Salmonella enterica subsp. arizonae serovar 18:z4,z23:- str. CVM N26624]OLW01903.1 hypothetical protein P298_10530 [Salmonella ente
MLREFSFLEKEGKDRVTKSLILLWRFIPITQYGRKGMKEYYIVAFYGTSSLPDVCERPSSHSELQPAIIHFLKSLSSKMHATSIYFYVYMIKYSCDE